MFFYNRKLFTENHETVRLQDWNQKMCEQTSAECQVLAKIRLFFVPGEALTDSMMLLFLKATMDTALTVEISP